MIGFSSSEEHKETSMFGIETFLDLVGKNTYIIWLKYRLFISALQLAVTLFSAQFKS